MVRRHSEMCGRGYFDISVHSCPLTGVRGWLISSFISSNVNSVGYSVLSWSKNVTGMRDATRLYRHIEWLVVSKIETENQRSLSTGTA